jgi:hypothetical protein
MFAAFHLPKPALPLNTGLQMPVWQAAGPRTGREAGHAIPRPYVTAFVNFVTAGPYGTADSRRGRPQTPNIFTGHAPFYPLGYRKGLTGSGLSF